MNGPLQPKAVPVSVPDNSSSIVFLTREVAVGGSATNWPKSISYPVRIATATVEVGGNLRG